MQVILNNAVRVVASGNGDNVAEPELHPRTLIVNVSQISVNALGSVTIKVQHSYDGINWVDIPRLSTGAITNTGLVSVAIESSTITADTFRTVWTFNNANSITFTAVIIGVKS